MGFSLVLESGVRYMEWVNMSYPAWTPLWSQRRAREYYLSSSNDENIGLEGVATPAQEEAMAVLSLQLQRHWDSAAGTS
eukprot:COSAG02_NODE_595_length_19813_cov_12.215380_8_plen_79_part_00